MKFVTFAAEGGPRPGVMREDLDTLVDLGSIFPSLLALIEAGPDGIEAAKSALKRDDAVVRELAGLRLLAPLPVPQSIRDCSVFEEHLKSAARAATRTGAPPFKIPDVWYKQPVYYKGNRFSVIGPDAEIVWPPQCSRLDYELEIAAVIGRPGKNLAPGQAMQHVFGFMIFNDMSARDFQGLDMQGLLGPAKGKDFDSGNAMGPWLVTTDELDIYNLDMKASLNGEYVGGGSSSSMYYKWDAIISHISRDETLHSGEVIGSGTVGGGTLAEHGRSLSPGDLIEFEIDGLGTLRNRVVKST